MASAARITRTPKARGTMNWKKTRIVLNTWQEGDYRITENPEANADERFRLDVFGGDLGDGGALRWRRTPPEGVGPVAFI